MSFVMDQRTLAARFCSLGASCELGYVQRNVGAEPLDLFRWAAIPIDRLIAGLNGKFIRLGDVIELLGGDPHSEWGFHDIVYHFHSHTGLHGDEIQSADLQRKIKARLSWQRNQLFADLAEGRRIFVRWTSPFDDEQLGPTELAEALRRYGPAELLWVTSGGTGVQRSGVGQLRGYVPQLAHRDSQHTADTDSWLRLLESAVKLVDQPDA
jgi:hypothetical protein